MFFNREPRVQVTCVMFSCVQGGKGAKVHPGQMGKPLHPML